MFGLTSKLTAASRIVGSLSPGELEPDRPFTLPAGVEPGPRRSLISHPDFEIPRPTLVGAVGFFATWVGVGLLIAAFFWILNWRHCARATLSPSSPSATSMVEGTIGAVEALKICKKKSDLFA